MTRIIAAALGMSLVGTTAAFADMTVPGMKTTHDAAPVLFDRSVPGTVALIEESSDVAYVTVTDPMTTSTIEMADPTPASLVRITDRNAVTAVELEPRATLEVGAAEVEVPTDSVEDVNRGAILMVSQDVKNGDLTLGEEITKGDLYYGQDGTVYMYMGPVIR